MAQEKSGENKRGELRNSEKEAQKDTERLALLQTSNSEHYEELAKQLASLGISMPQRTAREIKKLLKTSSRKQEKLNQEIGGLKQRIGMESDYKTILSKAKARCPVCDTRLSPKERMRIVDQKTKIIQSLRKRIKDGREESENAKKAIGLLDDIESNLKASADVGSDLSRAESRLAPVKRRLPSLESKRVYTTKLIKSLESRISAIADRILLAKKFSTIDDLRAEAAGLKTKLRVLPKVETDLKKVESETERLDKKRKDVDEEVRELGPKIENVGDKLKDSEDWFGRLAEMQDRTQIAYEFADEVGFAHEAAKLSLHEAFGNYCSMINANLAWIWPRLYDRSDLKQIELDLQIKEIEENEEPILTAEVQLMRSDAKENKLPFTTISSHGQRVLASIAFRVAFLNLLSRTSVPRVLVLDEIDRSILDNFDQLKDRNLISRLMSLGICVILLADTEESFAELDVRIRSSIPSIIRLSDYTSEQAFDIIRSRAEKALTRWSYTDAVLKKIAENVHGNITLGLNALKAGALKAESEGKKTIEESDIEIENDCPGPKLTRDEKVIFEIVQEWKSLPSSRLYTFYVEKSRHPKGERAFRNYMQSLCSKGLVEAVGDKRGRIYEFKGEEIVQDNGKVHQDRG